MIKRFMAWILLDPPPEKQGGIVPEETWDDWSQWDRKMLESMKKKSLSKDIFEFNKIGNETGKLFRRKM